MASAAVGRVMGSARKSLAMGPSVRSLLNQYKLEADRISSTGPHNIMLKGDVLEYITKNKLQPNRGSSPVLVLGQRTGTSQEVASKLTHNSQTNQTLKTSSHRYVDGSTYARRYPSAREIEVINSGGVC